jgi:hypothetical protein
VVRRCQSGDGRKNKFHKQSLRSGMKILATQIERELQLGGRAHCAVYEDELVRLWPLNEKDREAKIA